MAAGTIYFLFVDDGETQTSRPARGKPVVYSTLYPLHYFVVRIAGDLVDAELAGGSEGVEIGAAGHHRVGAERPGLHEITAPT